MISVYKDRSRILAHYSSSALLFIGGAYQTYAQVEYTDIEPDVVLDNWGENYHLDIDADGEADFHFNLIRSTYETWEFGQMNTYEKVQVNVDGQHLSFKIAGATDYGFSYWGTFYRYLPKGFDAGELIGSSLTFYNADWRGDALRNQFLGYREINGPVFDWDAWSFSLGYWMPEATEQFMGFEISNGIERSQYGWIRLSVLDSGKVLIIHDFALEQQLGVPIIAGDTIGTITSVISNEVAHAPLWMYPNPGTDQLTIQAPQAGVYYYMVKNAIGEVLFHITSANTSINIPAATWPKGTYLVSCIAEDTSVSWQNIWIKQ